MNHLQKGRLLIAFIVIWTIIFCIAVYKASAKEFVYNTNFLPPRTQQLCDDARIGVAYQPRLEKRCRGLWNAWTEEILASSFLSKTKRNEGNEFTY